MRLSLIQKALKAHDSTLKATKMSVKAVIAYPHNPSGRFDIDYYMSTHMPLVAKHYTPFGLQKWEVLQFTATGDGSAPAYVAQTILTWENEEQIQKAGASEAGKMLTEDIPNFSSDKPIFMIGKSAGSS